MLPLSPLVVLSLFSVVHGAIGPKSDLHVVNKEIAPDGFSRPCVNCFITSEIC